MREVTPEVYLIGRPNVDVGEMRRYLADVGGEAWLDRVEPLYEMTVPIGHRDVGARVNSPEGRHGEALVEFGGRLCYRSWEPGLNANVTKVREDSGEYFDNVLASGHGSVTEHGFYVFVFHNVSRVFCYDDDTEVLTTEGWVPWPKVNGDECFGTLNPETGELEYQHATDHYSFDYTGPMYRVQSEQVDLLVTPNHRMWVQPVDTQAYRRGEQPYVIREAQEIQGKRMRYQKCAGWTGEDPGEVVIPATERRWERSDNGAETVRAYPEARFPVRPFARFLGYFLSEGSINRHHICLAQNRGPVLDKMVEAISEMGLHPYIVPEPHQGGVRTSHTALRDWIGGVQAWEKRVPEIVGTWTPDLIREFLDAYIEGDGSTRLDGGHRVIYTSSPGMADDLQVLAIKAGWSANVRVDDRTGQSRVMASGQTITNRRPCYIVSIITQRTRPTVNRKAGQHDGMVDYDGRVHCVTVPNGLLFVRRNGKPVVSHNTHELVRHRAGTSISQESMRYVRLTDLPIWTPDWAREDTALMERNAKVAEVLEEHQRWMAEHFDLDATKRCEALAHHPASSAADSWYDAITCTACSGTGQVSAVPFSEKKAKTSYMRRWAPDGVATSIVWGANIRALRHTITMRAASSAEEEIDLVFRRVHEIMAVEAPLLFADFEVTDAGVIPEHRKV